MTIPELDQILEAEDAKRKTMLAKLNQQKEKARDLKENIEKLKQIVADIDKDFLEMDGKIAGMFEESFRALLSSTGGFLDRIIGNQAILDQLKTDLEKGFDFVRKKKRVVEANFEIKKATIREMKVRGICLSLKCTCEHMKSTYHRYRP